MDFIGMVPAYSDESGEIFADVGEVDVGEVGDHPRRERRAQRRLDHLDQRISRLAARESKIQQKFGGGAPAKLSMADAYQLAAAQGLINENQYDGLGYAVVAATSTGTLSISAQRNYWVKSFVYTSSAGAGLVLITAINIAGLPLAIGTAGIPVEVFAFNATRFGLSFGRKLVQTGQQIVTSLQNLNSSASTVSGGVLVDELNPYASQKWTEQSLVSAALSGFGLGGTC